MSCDGVCGYKFIFKKEISMFAKFFWALWAIFAAICILLFATNELTLIAITVMGFIACSLVFMGMMCVLPTLVEESMHKANDNVAEIASQGESKREAPTWRGARLGMAEVQVR